MPILMPMLPKFSKKEAISAGWQIFKANWKFLVAVTAISLVISYAPTAVSQAWSNQYPVPAVLFSLIFWVVGLVVSIGLVKIFLNLVDGKAVNFTDLYAYWRLVWYYLLVQILAGIIIFLGLIFLVVPGIIFGIRLQFASYYVIDKGLGPLAAVKASWAATRGSVRNLFLFGILIGLVYLLGVIVIGVGLLAAIPVSGLAVAVVYRKLAA